MLLRLPPDPTSATRLRALDPDWHRRFVDLAGDPAAPSLKETILADPEDCSTAARPSSRSTSRRFTASSCKSLDDDQAVEVVTIPLAGKSSIADHMVIASGRSSRQVASMATKLAEQDQAGIGQPVRIEGLPAADWVLIDADDVIVHLFRPEVRSFYNLERMWAFGDETAPKAAAPGADADAGAAAHRRPRQDRPVARGRAGRALSEAHRLADQGDRASRSRRHAFPKPPPTASPWCSTSAARRCRRWNSPESSKAGATAAGARRAS